MSKLLRRIKRHRRATRDRLPNIGLAAVPV
jgi:hypothetical protein